MYWHSMQITNSLPLSLANVSPLCSPFNQTSHSKSRAFIRNVITGNLLKMWEREHGEKFDEGIHMLSLSQFYFHWFIGCRVVIAQQYITVRIMLFWFESEDIDSKHMCFLLGLCQTQRMLISFMPQASALFWWLVVLLWLSFQIYSAIAHAEKR